jgi:hypothetical protein
MGLARLMRPSRKPLWLQRFPLRLGREDNGSFFSSIEIGLRKYEIDYFQIVKGIGGSIFAVLIMSFYGGIAGVVIMTLAALLRKRRLRKHEERGNPTLVGSGPQVGASSVQRG